MTKAAEVTKIQAATADQILSNRLRVEPLYVKEWDQIIHIREMAGVDSGVLGNLTKPDGINAGVVVDVCHKTICDENGNRLFTSKDQKEKLGQLSYSALQSIFVAALNITGATEEGMEDAKKD